MDMCCDFNGHSAPIGPVNVFLNFQQQITTDMLSAAAGIDINCSNISLIRFLTVVFSHNKADNFFPFCGDNKRIAAGIVG